MGVTTKSLVSPFTAEHDLETGFPDRLVQEVLGWQMPVDRQTLAAAHGLIEAAEQVVLSDTYSV